MKFYIFFLAVLFIACGQSENKKEMTPGNVTGKEIKEVPPVKTGLPSIPRELMVKLFEEATYIDYVFQNLPFSLSQSEKGAIQTNLSYISVNPQAVIPGNCKPLGRQFYQIEGEIVLEADIYLAEGCKFYVFFVDGKAIYANKMTEQGVNFFDSVIAQASNVSKKAQQ